MANLTEISIGVRKTAKFAGIAIISIMVIRFLLIIGIAYWKATHLPPAAPPDIAFGTLPKPKFPEGKLTSSGLTYILENIEGKPPETTEAARVFSLPKKNYTFESGENAKDLARKLNFESTPRIDTVYYFYTKEEIPGLSLFIDSTSLNFQYKYNYFENPGIFRTGLIPSIEDAEKNAKEFLTFSNLWDDSILQGNTKSDILIFDDRLKQMAEASSLSNSQAVRVNFFRKEIDKLPLLSDEFTKSANYVLFADTQGTQLNNILEVSYFFWPIDMNSFASYPLISGDEAYQSLSTGSATIINKGNNRDQITIRKIYLAYLDSAIPQLYMQPIFVFEGDNDFVAYLAAIRSQYLQ